VRAAGSEHDDSTLLRHRRELTEELDEEDKPRARSKVPYALTISGRGKIWPVFSVIEARHSGVGHGG